MIDAVPAYISWVAKDGTYLGVNQHLANLGRQHAVPSSFAQSRCQCPQCHAEWRKDYDFARACSISAADARTNIDARLGNFPLLTVSDTGTGIPQEYLR